MLPFLVPHSPRLMKGQMKRDWMLRGLTKGKGARCELALAEYLQIPALTNLSIVSHNKPMSYLSLHCLTEKEKVL